MIKLDILSDPICPWCYIGKTRLEKALADVPDHPFVIEWHPFQLNPDMPAEGMDRRTYLETKFGGKENAVRVYGEIEKHAREDGLDLDFGAIQKTPNTVDAHRLIHWAGIEGKQDEIVNALFTAYFHEGRDIGSREVLCDIADSCGLDAAVIGKLLKSDEDVDMIHKRDTHSREMGVNSVPTFIIANQHAVPGAQPADLWIKVIEELKEKEANA
ncbi:MAG: DsbA family oxidoreductase [Shimia thalassica]|uniref:DsbA family oxidoreductase n=1 Tax=Shimia thalassica TaxID=1715693 RepID=UPI0032976247